MSVFSLRVRVARARVRLATAYLVRAWYVAEVAVLMWLLGHTPREIRATLAEARDTARRRRHWPLDL